MKNGDLKRFYGIDPMGAKDFVRLDETGKIPAALLPLDDNGDLLVTVTQADTTYTADVGYAAILAAFPRVKATVGATGSADKLVFLPDALTGTDLTFNHVYLGDNAVALKVLTFEADGTITVV